MKISCLVILFILMASGISLAANSGDVVINKIAWGERCIAQMMNGLNFLTPHMKRFL